ncbi:hypothetical protein [Natronincola ferrireducens]|uniref:Uncharacterized protein n=1 Tax=Natronincola ferrireducens TaxID=393762 RepID=A0A1G8YWK6_9FIRM|nr:hypothetical protein [Natronincola ferrireducens]SDK07208.1 hypothetical protein SAMN05660472_00669 [Natronincola ferrireducens]
MGENIESNKINEEDISKEKVVEEVMEEENNGSYTFLINASNQGNLTNTYNASSLQMNAVFVMVSPYYIEKFNLEGLDLNISVDEKGTVKINNESFKSLEIKPGVRIFGISKEN